MVFIVLHIFCLMTAVVVHEYCHGIAAYFLGDDTAKSMGRLSLNPIVHLDFLGSFLLPIGALLLGSPVMIGWAKPVPISMGNFRHPYRDMMWVALAGPLSNFVMAALSLIVILFFPSESVKMVAVYFLQINVVLACFNLIPIPPLDGSRILAYFSPQSGREFLYKIEPYGILLVLILAYLGILNHILELTAGGILQYLDFGIL